MKKKTLIILIVFIIILGVAAGKTLFDKHKEDACRAEAAAKIEKQYKSITKRAMIITADNEENWNHTEESKLVSNSLAYGLDAKIVEGKESAEVLDTIAEYFAEADDDDINYIFISTHGSKGDPDEGVLPEFTTSLKEMNGINSHDFRNACDGLSGNTVIFMDTCYAGYFAKDFWTAGSAEEYAEQHYTFMTTCDDTESLVGDTTFVTEAITEAADRNGDYIITTGEMYDCYAERLYEWEKSITKDERSKAIILGRRDIIISHNIAE